MDRVVHLDGRNRVFDVYTASVTCSNNHSIVFPIVASDLLDLSLSLCRNTHAFLSSLSHAHGRLQDTAQTDRLQPGLNAHSRPVTLAFNTCLGRVIRCCVAVNRTLPPLDAPGHCWAYKKACRGKILASGRR